MARRVILMVFVLLCIGTQVRMFFRWDSGFYPFVPYAMYSGARQPPVETTRTRMYAHMPDGREIEIDYGYMGLDWHAWYREVAKPLSLPPTGQDATDKDRARHDEALDRVTAQVRRMEHVPPDAVVLVIQQYRVVDGDIHTGIDSVRVPVAATTEARHD